MPNDSAPPTTRTSSQDEREDTRLGDDDPQDAPVADELGSPTSRCKYSDSRKLEEEPALCTVPQEFIEEYERALNDATARVEEIVWYDDPTIEQAEPEGTGEEFAGSLLGLYV